MGCLKWEFVPSGSEKFTSWRRAAWSAAWHRAAAAEIGPRKNDCWTVYPLERNALVVASASACSASAPATTVRTTTATAATAAVKTTTAATVGTAAAAAATVRAATAESPRGAGVCLRISDAAVECPEFGSVLIFLHDLFGNHEALRSAIEGEAGSGLPDAGAFGCHRCVGKPIRIYVRIADARKCRGRDTAKFLRRRTEKFDTAAGFEADPLHRLTLFVTNGEDAMHS